jgi:hypothetical protein
VAESIIESLAVGLRLRYGKIRSILNYLGMVLDFSHPREARVTMMGFVEVKLKSSVVTVGATEGLFEIKSRIGGMHRGAPERVPLYGRQDAAPRQSA